MTLKDGTGWVLFDKVEQKFLMHGNTVEYGYTSNPLEAHIYLNEDVAFRRARILLDGFLVNIAKNPDHLKKKCELQLVPVVGVCGIAEDILHVKKPRKTGFVVHVLSDVGAFADDFAGFYKKPPYHSLEEEIVLNPWRHLVDVEQDATVWKARAAAQRWCDAIVGPKRARNRNTLKFKTKVVEIK